jgi:hypothetical protein
MLERAARLMAEGPPAVTADEPLPDAMTSLDCTLLAKHEG